MALTLNPTLATAQDSLNRQPLVEIMSKSWTNALPMDGNLLTSGALDSGPAIITHSSGRLCFTYIHQGTPDIIRYSYTDEDRISFTTIDFNLFFNDYDLTEVTITELIDGNIGILYCFTYSGTKYLRYKIITELGVLVSDDQVTSWATTLFSSGLHVITLSNDTYIAVFARQLGSDYEIYKITSSDFIFWSAASNLSIAGLDSTKKRQNPSLVQISNNDIILWFDYVEVTGVGGSELTNLYYSTSIDNGVTWDAVTKVTSYSDFSTVALHPVAVQKEVNKLHLIYYELIAALQMEVTNLGGGPTFSFISNMHFDDATRKLYVLVTYRFSGTKKLEGVSQIDVDTWTIDKTWNDLSTPAFNSIYVNQHVWWERWVGEGKYIPVGIWGIYYTGFIAVLNADVDTITQYNFIGNSTYGLVKNVSWTQVSSAAPVTGGERLCFCFIDEDSDRMYLLFQDTYLYALTNHVGYIDLTHAGPEYEFVTIFTESKQVNQMEFYVCDFFIAPNDDYGFISGSMLDDGNNASLRVFLLSEDALYKDYRYASFPNLPINGLKKLVYTNGKIYGVFTYSANASEVDKRGLCEINISTDNIKYYRPSWATVDEYGLRGLEVLDDGRILISSSLYGVTIFDPSDETWSVYNNTTLLGMTPDGGDDFRRLAYDTVNGMVFAGTALVTTIWDGLVAFLEAGLIKQAQYMLGDYGASWVFATNNDLVVGLLDYEAAICLHPTTQSIYAFWTSQLINESFIKWGEEISELNLTSYLLQNAEVTTTHSVEPEALPNKLTFSVSHGHLFDTTNADSLLMSYLQKSRKLTLRWGECISGANYWQNAGIFEVVETSLSAHKRGQYPVMKVMALDIRHRMEQHNIPGTAYYEMTPELTLEAILKTHMDFVDSDIDLPVFDNPFVLEAQWLDCTVKEMIDQIADRFEHSVVMDCEGKLTTRKIATDNVVNHIYGDTSHLDQYSPDDKYSSLVNRIVVTGEERDWIEVLYNEERVLTITGTAGWWGFSKDYRRYYSEDRKKRCRNPRLEIVISAKSGGFKWFSYMIDEYISYVDPEDKYCVVYVSVPDLTWVLVAALAIYAAAVFIFDEVVTDVTTSVGTLVDTVVQVCPISGEGVGVGTGSGIGIGVGTGFTIPVGRILESVGILLAFWVLSICTNFHYDIWAQPVGEVRRSIVGQADDVALQNKVGIIKQKIEGWQCFSMTECVRVAEYLLMLEMFQRSRLNMTKIAHLQDEAGDTIVHPHPYTGKDLKFFITKLHRRFKKSSKGYFLDKITGWKI